MRIVGKTDKGYLAQITEQEIGIILGFGKYPQYNERKDEFNKIIGIPNYSTKDIPTNTELTIIEGLDYILTIKEKIKTARKTAKELRELADLLDTAIPEVLIPEKLIQ